METSVEKIGMHHTFKIIAFVLLIGFLQGCVSNSATGGYTLNAFDESYDTTVGRQLYQSGLQQSGGAYKDDPRIQRYISNVAMHVAESSGIDTYHFEITVVDNPTPNAWALPGGKLAINTGMLSLLDSESELAAVIGHEMGHVTARHGSRKQTKSTIASLGVLLVDSIAGNGVGTVAAYAASFMNAGFSRSHEIEADRIGSEYMIAAGYSPYGAVKLQERLAELNGKSSGLKSLLATHPQSEKRAKRNLEIAQKYNGGIVETEGYGIAMAPLRDKQEGYDLLKEASKSANNKEYKAAYEHVRQALEIMPRYAKAWELKGDIESQLSLPKMAGRSYKKAVSINPDYFSHHLALGLHEVRLGSKDKAYENLFKSDRLLKTAPGSFYLGVISLERDNFGDARDYLYRVASSRSTYTNKAAALIKEHNL